MTPVERRSVGSLAAIYASRMLGMFLMLPVLALYAHTLPDYSPEMLGLAMGAYGLTQAVLQIPFGRWSDRFGRKPLITIGLLFYALGSVLGMYADTVTGLAIARVRTSARVRSAISAVTEAETAPAPWTPRARASIHVVWANMPSTEPMA